MFGWLIRSALILTIMLTGYIVFRSVLGFYMTGEICMGIRGTQAIDCGIFAKVKLAAIAFFLIVSARLLWK